MVHEPRKGSCLHTHPSIFIGYTLSGCSVDLDRVGRVPLLCVSEDADIPSGLGT